MDEKQATMAKMDPAQTPFWERDRMLFLIANELRLTREQQQNQFEWFKSHSDLVTSQDLKNMEKRIMSAISDYIAAVTAFQDREDIAIEGIVTDIKFINDKLTAIENSPGALSPEDQAALTASLTRTGTVTAKLEALSSANAPVPPAV